jgi:hypothetical protein
MILRNISEGDYDALKKIYQDSGLPPACSPDPANPLCFIKQAAIIDGEIAVAAMARLTAEASILVNPRVANSTARMIALRALCSTVCQAGRNAGLEDATCWVPPELADGNFGQRLAQLGFVRSPWPTFSIDLTKEDL